MMRVGLFKPVHVKTLAAQEQQSGQIDEMKECP
jgi:hypothetical protein